MVAAIFIALAPAQTIAALSLMYLVILVSTVYVACCIYTLQDCQKKCKMVCKLSLLTVTYLCLVVLAICFTLIYIDFSKNGLTPSTVGSVLLSLFPAMTVLFISIAIERQLKQINFLGSGENESGTSESQVTNGTSSNERTPLVQ